MTNLPELSEAKRVLLEQYLQGRSLQTAGNRDALRRRDNAEEASLPTGVMGIQTHGSKRPFFFLHGQWESRAFYCFPLAQGLGSDQPFYVLEPYTFDGISVPPTLEEVAATHIKLMRTVQPEGPYLLGGWCNGALMAYEMARQLHIEGQKVDLLVLMNSMALVYPIGYKLTRSMLICLGKLMRLDQVKQIDWYIRLRRTRLYLLHMKDYLRIHVRKVQASLSLGSAEQIELWRKHEVVFPNLRSYIPTSEALCKDYESVFTWLTLAYKPSNLYPGKITFFWSSDDWSSKEPFHRGWRKVEEVNDVDIHIFPGQHLTLVTDQLDVLIDHLRKCLEKVQGPALNQRETI